MTSPPEESLERSKKTGLKLVEILGGLAVDTLAGGLPVAELIRRLSEHCREWYQDRQRRRLADFHRKLLEPLSEQERRAFLEAEMDPEDYYSVLKHVVDEEEEEKVEYYAALLRSLVLGTYETEIRRHFLKSVRLLSRREIDLLACIVGASKSTAREPDADAPENQIRRLVQDRTGIIAAGIQNLIRWGYLETGKRSNVPWPSSLAGKLIGALDIEGGTGNG